MSSRVSLHRLSDFSKAEKPLEPVLTPCRLTSSSKDQVGTTRAVKRAFALAPVRAWAGVPAQHLPVVQVAGILGRWLESDMAPVALGQLGGAIVHLSLHKREVAGCHCPQLEAVRNGTWPGFRQPHNKLSGCCHTFLPLNTCPIEA